MAHRVFKYKLCTVVTDIGGIATPDVVTIQIPTRAVILSAGNQGNDVVVWADVVQGEPNKPRDVALVKTGDSPPTRYSRFIGTVSMFDGSYILHIYDMQ